jgi:hypothetical protein
VVGGELDVEAEPSKGTIVAVVVTVRAGRGWGGSGSVFGGFVVFVSGGFVYIWKGVFGLAGGPLGIVKLRLGWISAWGDADAPVVI